MGMYVGCMCADVQMTRMLVQCRQPQCNWHLSPRQASHIPVLVSMASCVRAAAMVQGAWPYVQGSAVGLCLLTVYNGH
jgi:hypothetical protein